jgi:hypothetical protein
MEKRKQNQENEKTSCCLCFSPSYENQECAIARQLPLPFRIIIAPNYVLFVLFSLLPALLIIMVDLKKSIISFCENGEKGVH